jgi:hypothetical protein
VKTTRTAKKKPKKNRKNLLIFHHRKNPRIQKLHLESHYAASGGEKIAK